MTREEKAKSTDMGDYYRIPADTRDLNYGKYLENGNMDISEAQEYNSHNTVRLDVANVIEKLKTVDHINDELATQGMEA
jgi:UDP-glucose 4-epimerase